MSCTAPRTEPPQSRCGGASHVSPDITPLLPLIRHEARRVWFQSCRRPDREDLFQEAVLGVLRRVGGHDPSRCKLQTYVSNLARWAALDYVRGKGQSGARPPANHTVSLDADQRDFFGAHTYTYNGDSGRMNLLSLLGREDPALAALFARDDCAALLSLASPRQRQCIEVALLGGLTYEQAGAKLGMVPGTVCAHVSAGLKRIRRACGQP